MNDDRRHQDKPGEGLDEIFKTLGIPAHYLATCGLPPQPECATLVDTELDVFGRQPRLEPHTFAAWTAMKRAAHDEGIELQLVSAFRSVAYQRDLFLRKLARGDSIASILAVNAAPGFSEHHSGRALDVGTPGFAHLEEEFENSPAFAWLLRRAAGFGFRLSFPRGNPHGVLYEPWHWYFAGTTNSKSSG